MSEFVEVIEAGSRLWIQAMSNALWLGAILTAAVAAGLKLAPRVNAATRHAVWSVALAALLTLPFVLMFAGGDAPSEDASRTPASFEAIAVPAGEPLRPEVIPSSAPAAVAIAAEPDRESADLGLAAAMSLRVDETGAALSNERVVKAFAPAPARRPLLTLPAGLAVALFAAWAVVALFRLLRVARGYICTLALARDTEPLDAKCQRRLRTWLAAYGMRQDVELRRSSRISVPMAIGLGRPIILVPDSLRRKLTVTEFDHIGLHELAHLMRRDDWTYLAQLLGKAVFFFNPAIYWVSARLNIEREIACDDCVVSETGSVKPYATCLTHLVELTARRPDPMMAAAAFTTRKSIIVRIDSLLNRGRNCSTRLSSATVALSAAALASVLAGGVAVGPAIAVPRSPLTTALDAMANSSNSEDAVSLTPPVQHAAPAAGSITVESLGDDPTELAETIETDTSPVEARVDGALEEPMAVAAAPLPEANDPKPQAEPIAEVAAIPARADVEDSSASIVKSPVAGIWTGTMRRERERWPDGLPVTVLLTDAPGGEVTGFGWSPEGGGPISKGRYDPKTRTFDFSLDILGGAIISARTRTEKLWGGGGPTISGAAMYDNGMTARFNLTRLDVAGDELTGLWHGDAPKDWSAARGRPGLYSIVRDSAGKISGTVFNGIVGAKIVSGRFVPGSKAVRLLLLDSTGQFVKADFTLGETLTPIAAGDEILPGRRHVNAVRFSGP